MPRYRFQAISSQGESIQGELEASGREAVIEDLQRVGHLPVRAEEITGARRWHWKDLGERLRRTYRARGMALSLTLELATLLRAGLPLDQALAMTGKLAHTPEFLQLVQRLRERIQGGIPFSEALSLEGTAFSPIYLSLIRAGEASGQLGPALANLAEHMERTAEMRSSLLSALIYPAVLVIVAIMTIVLLMAFVIPQFVPLFDDAGAALPWLTQALFTTSELFRDYWWAGLAVLTGTVWFSARQLAVPQHRLAFDTACLKVPFVGALLSSLEAARIGHTLSILLNQGVPILMAIRLTQNVIGNQALAANWKDVSEALAEGKTMSSILRTSEHFPRRAIQLIEVGESSGQLPDMLRKIGEIYERESQAQIKRLLTLVEPMLILGLGGLIAAIITSVLLAILELNNLVV